MGEWLMLGYALLGLLVAGAWHLGGLLLVKRVKPNTESHPYLGVLLAFWGIAFLHLSEIAIAAGSYAIALSFHGAGAIHGGYGESAGGLLYFSGITYATLGMTDQTVTGPIRLLAMVQSLTGFMLITWSATFVYSVWGDEFRADHQRTEAEDRGKAE